MISLVFFKQLTVDSFDQVLLIGRHLQERYYSVECRNVDCFCDCQLL